MQSNVLDVVQIAIHSSILPVKQLVRENRRRFGVAYIVFIASEYRRR